MLIHKCKKAIKNNYFVKLNAALKTLLPLMKKKSYFGEW